LCTWRGAAKGWVCQPAFHGELFARARPLASHILHNSAEARKFGGGWTFQVLFRKWDHWQPQVRRVKVIDHGRVRVLRKKITACAVPQVGPLATSGEARQGDQPRQSPSPFGRKSQRELFRKWDHWRPQVRRGKVLDHGRVNPLERERDSAKIKDAPAFAKLRWPSPKIRDTRCAAVAKLRWPSPKIKDTRCTGRRQVALAVAKIKDTRCASRRQVAEENYSVSCSASGTTCNLRCGASRC